MNINSVLVSRFDCEKVAKWIVNFCFTEIAWFEIIADYVFINIKER